MQEIVSEDFTKLTAAEALDGLKAKRFTVTHYISALADCIEALDPELRAWTWFDRGQALDQARALDGEGPSPDLPLFGIPAGIKDIIDTKDMPTENGTVLDAGRRPGADAALVRALREAGAIVMGKTATAELAFLHPPRARNPRNPAHTPGGSSSGSAAAVAAGMVPVALGTQTNGSVIRPASFCGIFGLKPSYGLLPMGGILEESPALDTAGIFARSLPDLALIAGALVPRKVEYLIPAGGAQQVPPRLAFIRSPAWKFAEERTRHAFLRLLEQLRPHCGEIELPAAFDAAIGFHRTIMYAEAALNFAPYYERGKESLSATLRSAIEEGRRVTAVDYVVALRARDELYARLDGLLGPHVAILTPPATGPAPRGLGSTGNPVFCTLWTYLGMPAISLPLLEVEGLPLGVQLVARRDGEALLFACADWLLRAATGKAP